MIKKLFIFPVFVLLAACAGREFAVQKNYDHPFFHTKNWSYAWFMLEDDSGKLSSTMSDSIGNEIMDTVKYYWTALCPVDGDTAFHVIHYASAQLNRDTLLLRIAEGTASTNDDLVVKIFKGRVSASYSTVFFFYYNRNDVSWTTIRQDLTLNQEEFQSGDTLKGYIDFACVEHWKKQPEEAGLKTKEDTIRIQGPFKCVMGGQ